MEPKTNSPTANQKISNQTGPYSPGKKYIVLLIVVVGILTVGAGLFLINPSPEWWLTKVSPVKITPTPRPAAEFARPEGQKASYNSTYLQQVVFINNTPEFVAVPASFITNDDQGTGVVVKVIDNRHFLLEVGKLLIPTVISDNTWYSQYAHRPDTPVNSPQNFTVKLLFGDHSENIKQLDFLTVHYNKISASSSAVITNWQQDKDNYYQAKSILLYEKR